MFLLYIVTLLASLTAAEYFIPVPNNLNFPINFSTSTNSLCKEQYEVFVNSLRNNTLWAYRLWDASAKITAGLAEGSTYQLGNYDECLSITEPYKAQYCLATIYINLLFDHKVEDPFSKEYKPYDSIYQKIYYSGDPSKVKRDKLTWGFCIPASCDFHDLQTAMQEYLNKDQNPQIKSYEILVEESDCQYNRFESIFTTADYSFCIFLVFTIAVVVLCTIYHIKTFNSKETQKQTKISKILLCFSAKQNFDALSKPDGSGDALNIFYGIKFLLLISLVAGHSILNILIRPIYNYEEMEQINRHELMTALWRGEITVDVYFLISGILSSYNYLIQTETKQINIIRAIILRYMRLVPMFALVTYFYATLYYKLGSGPLWNRIVGSEMRNCQKNWWANLIALNNYIDVKHLCILPGWHIPAEFHFYILSFSLNALIKRNTKLCWTILLIILCGTVSLPFCITYFGNKDPFLMIFNDFMINIRQTDVFENIYVVSHTRVSVYIIGNMFGYFYYKKRNAHFELSALSTAALSIFFVAIPLSCVLSASVFVNPYRAYTALEASFYAALYRPASSLAIAAGLIGLGYGRMTMLRQFAVWKPFIVLGKLSFGGYLVHMSFQTARAGMVRTPQIFSFYSWVCEIILDTTLAMMTAFVLHILIETPFGKLARELLPSDACSIKTKHAEESAGKQITNVPAQ